MAGAAAASANTAAATSNAYSAGVAAGGAGGAGYVMGAIYGTLPAGCASRVSRVRPTTCAAIHGSSRPMGPTASTIEWCRLPDAMGGSGGFCTRRHEMMGSSCVIDSVAVRRDRAASRLSNYRRLAAAGSTDKAIVALTGNFLSIIYKTLTKQPGIP